MSTSTTTQPTTSSRSRTQSWKKVNDDAAYFGPPASSTSVSVTKRQAPDKAEGEPRVKQKQVETHTDIRGNWSVKCSEGKMTDPLTTYRVKLIWKYVIIRLLFI